MTIMTLGDVSWTILCDWCGRGVKEIDVTETLDGSQLCTGCISHYTADQDADDGDVITFISNIDERD